MKDLIPPQHLKGFLSPEVCDRYVDFLKSTDKWERFPGTVWDQRGINLCVQEDALREELLDLRLRVKEAVIQAFGVKEDFFCDIFQFVRWREGESLLPPHADAENPNGDPHPFPYRNYSAVIYLNDDYEGGEIFFPNFNLIPRLEKGDLVIFKGTMDYLHGVTEVTQGTRYTLVSFYTHEATHHDGYRF